MYYSYVPTLFSGAHTLTSLSMPTAPSLWPSQFHATWFIACVETIVISRGLNAENVGACISFVNGTLHSQHRSCAHVRLLQQKWYVAEGTEVAERL